MTRSRPSTRWAWLALIAMAGCSPRTGPASESPDTAPGEGPLAAADRLVALMQGSFSSRAQAQADPEYFDIRLHMLPIWTDRTDARWLYVEQAVATEQEKPYRQRVYRLTPGDGGTIVSAIYTIEDPQRFALAWREPGKLQALRDEDLTLRDGCEVLLRSEGPQRYVGATTGRRCASDLRGASWASTEVTVTADGMLSWDRGFDEQDRQVWGATRGGYQFRHDDPRAPAAAPAPKPAG